MTPPIPVDFVHTLAQYGYLAVFVFVAVESIGVPFPGETMLVTAAVYAGATHRLSILLIIGAAAAGAIIGDNIGYALGHWGGYRLLVRHGHHVRLHQAQVKVGRYVFLRHGVAVVFFGRFVAILRTFAALLAGATRMPRGRFLLANASGGIFWAAIFGVGAYIAGNQLTRVSRPLGIALGVGMVLAAAAVILASRRAEARLVDIAERHLPGPLPGYPGGKPL
jgi:membrane protein DedA with SNARE-associated domain